jgi:hypothetical protein
MPVEETEKRNRGKCRRKGRKLMNIESKLQEKGKESKGAKISNKKRKKKEERNRRKWQRKG